METQRLKNIIILILALLNLFLLVLLLNFRWQQNLSAQQLNEQIYRLYEASSLGLADPEHLSLDTAAPQSLSLQRSAALEKEMAAWLLESETEPIDQGGSIFLYEADAGTVTFRSNGAFDFAPKQRGISSPESFCDSFCSTFGYTVTRRALSNGSGTVTAERQVEGIPVYNCTVSFAFEDGQLLSLSGFCLSTDGSTALPRQQLSAADALVKFLDYRRLSGAVCSSVTAVRCVYDFSSAGQTPAISAKWQVSTDTYTYYVNSSTGDVSRG